MNSLVGRTHSGTESHHQQNVWPAALAFAITTVHKNGFCLKASTFALSLGEVKLKALDVLRGKLKV